jgi:hypothetical protein
VADSAGEFQDGIGKGTTGMGKLTRSAWLGKDSHRTKGGRVSNDTVLGDGGGGTQTPPMSGRAASHAPTCVGSVGTISAMRVGSSLKQCVKNLKSARWSRLLSLRRRASWRWENIPIPPRNGQGPAQFAEQLVALLGGDALAAPEQIEKLMDAGQDMGRLFDGPAIGVNQPAKDYFEGRPASIVFEHFLDKSGFLARGLVGGIERPKDVIEGAQCVCA